MCFHSSLTARPFHSPGACAQVRETRGPQEQLLGCRGLTQARVNPRLSHDRDSGCCGVSVGKCLSLCPGGSWQAGCGPLRCPRARGQSCPHDAWGEVVPSLQPTPAPQLLVQTPVTLSTLSCSNRALGKGSCPPTPPGWTSAVRDRPLPPPPKGTAVLPRGDAQQNPFQLTPGRGEVRLVEGGQGWFSPRECLTAPAQL